MATPTINYNVMRLRNKDGHFIDLTGFEIPQRFPLGGDQKVVLTEFVGFYKRQLQTLGAQPRPLEWTGAFYYETAFDRARFFEQLLFNADPVEITWGDINFKAIIRQFYWDAANQFSITYSVSCEIVTQDLSQVNYKIDPASADYISGSLLISIINGIQTALVTVRRAFAIASSIQQGGLNAISGAVANFLSIAGTVGTTLGTLTQTQAQDLVASATIIEKYAFQLAEEIQSGGEIDQAFPIADLVAISNSAKILQEMIKRYTQPQPSNTTTVMNDNVFAISQRVYGSAQYWQDIMDLNKLVDSAIAAPKTVFLPPIKNKAPIDPKGQKTVYEVGLPERKA